MSRFAQVCARVADIGLENLAVGIEVFNHAFKGEGFAAVYAGYLKVFEFKHIGKVVDKVLPVEQFTEHNALFHVFVAVNGGNAALCRTVGFVGKACFFKPVQCNMIGHNNDGTGAYHKVFRGDIDACIVQPFDFAAEVADVDNGAVAENIHLFTAENAGRQKIQRKCAVVVFDGVSCIVAALVTNNNVIFFRNEVNHSALALIAPVDAHDGACFHNLYSPFCIKPELFVKPKLCSGFVSGIECCIAGAAFCFAVDSGKNRAESAG